MIDHIYHVSTCKDLQCKSDQIGMSVQDVWCNGLVALFVRTDPRVARAFPRNSLPLLWLWNTSRIISPSHKPSQACWVRNAKLCQPGGWTYRNRLLASQHFTAIFDLNDVASWAQASHRYCNRSKARKYTSCSFDIRKPLQLGVSWYVPKSRGIFLVILSFRPLQYYILYWPLKAVNRSAAQNGHRAKQSKTWLHEGYNLEPVIPSDCSHAHWTSGKNNFLN